MKEKAVAPRLSCRRQADRTDSRRNQLMIRGVLYIIVFVGLPLLVLGTTMYTLATASGWLSVRGRTVLAIAVALGFLVVVYAYGPEWLQQTTFSIAPSLVIIA